MTHSSHTLAILKQEGFWSPEKVVQVRSSVKKLLDTKMVSNKSEMSLITDEYLMCFTSLFELVFAEKLDSENCSVVKISE